MTAPNSPSKEQSQALVKKSDDAALMPPPPPPKRIKRPAKVLDEDDYTDALSHIIARDFFPGLLESETQQDYLNALDSRDPGWIASAGKRLTEIMTPGPDGRRLRGRRGTSMTSTPGLHGRGRETPMMWQGDTPASATSTSDGTQPLKKEVIETNMSLGAFQSRYTSEDNESFYKLLDKQNSKRSERYAWMWANNKIPAARQIAHRKREAKLLAGKGSHAQSNGKELVKASSSDTRKAMPDSWRSRPDNNLMFEPTSIEDTHQTIQQKAEELSSAPPKAVAYDNTRLLTASSEPASVEPPPSPSLSAVQDAIAGRPRPSASEPAFNGASTPRINGYAFVDPEPPPEPSEPTSTWNGSDRVSLLGSGDAIPNPFNIKEGSKREALHYRMVDKVAKGKRSVGKRKSELSQTPVPRFASSPRVGTGGITPAGQRLLGKLGSGGKTPSVWESKGVQSVRGSGLRNVLTPTQKTVTGRPS